MTDDAKFFRPRLEEQIKKTADLDLRHVASILGLQKQDRSLLIDFFNRQIRYKNMGFADTENLPLTDAVAWVLSVYLLNCPAQKIKTNHRLVSFREFPGAGPLFSRFTANTAKIIETTFSGQAGLLLGKCLKLGAAEVHTAGYDISVRFRALQRVPILLNFNDVEEGMPASASFLFHDNAQDYLDLECMTVLTTYLTGQLIQTD